ncbi:4Fe-4S dicluster domain-containing protein [bacterium]|nr:4Fe-4S dicluster domain-containing protein [bacterium]
MSRYAIVVDLDHCTGCKGCEIACKNENHLRLGEHWNRLLLCGPYGDFPDLSQYYLPIMCQQCENAPCVEVCPTGASYRDEDTNVVLINQDACIGCQLCMSACPYGVREYDEQENVVKKCTLCKHLTDQGEKPFCVSACSVQCRYYGDLDDPESDASKALAAKPDAVHILYDEGNKPATAYLLSEKYCVWHDTPQGHDTNDNNALAAFANPA